MRADCEPDGYWSRNDMLAELSIMIAMLGKPVRSTVKLSSVSIATTSAKTANRSTTNTPRCRPLKLAPSRR